ncbi:MAG: hypothetical protein QGI83_13070 [Candidatus Latescibacteria bacterium]|nr:hypothetical protein [Candidatus Latescibacterota bacterium]
MRTKSTVILLFVALLIGGFAAGNYASGTSGSKAKGWDYTIIQHAPYLTERGSDLQKIREMGRSGWELASSYRVKGEVVISIFKRPK